MYLGDILVMGKSEGDHLETLKEVIRRLSQAGNNCEELKPYWPRPLVLSIHDGCILWGWRLVVPLKGKILC